MRCRATTTRLATLVAAVAVSCGCYTAAPERQATASWPGGGVQEDFRFPKLTGFPGSEEPKAVAVEAQQPVVVPVVSESPIAVPKKPKVLPRIQPLSNPRTDPRPARPSSRWDASVQPAGFRRLPATSGGYPVAPVAAELLPYDAGPLAASIRVTDTFLETDVRQAVQSLAGQAEATVIIDDQVRGTTTAIIDDQPFDTALSQVLLPLGFVHRKVDEVHYVGLADADSALFDYLSDRYRYTALHRDPAELASLLPERYQQFVCVSPAGGWLVVEAPPTHAPQVLSELEQLDQPVPQVVLEALVCVYEPKASFRFGFDVDAGVRIYDQSTRLALSGLNFGGALGAGAAASNLNDFQVTSSLLRMMEQKGFVKIRASPRVMALDGQKAEIRIGRESFFSVQPEGNDFLFRQDIQQVDSGILLEITPAIRAPYVTVKIDRAEVSEDIRSDETQADASDRFPVINRRSVSTTVKVLDGETIVIGGLTQRQKVDLRNKVPFFGDLPLVGKLFNRIEKVDTKAEVAIFISPRVLQEETDGVMPSHEPTLAQDTGGAALRAR